MLQLLQCCVKARLNIVISGGTGAGKTTLLNVLSSYIPEDERIVTIEDAAELRLRQTHVARMETRPANVEGHGAIRIRELVVNALRMRPDRIIVGECRSEEALDMLQAMNTGHDGSLTTVHANNPRDAIGRLEVMVGMANANMGVRSMRQQISSAIDMFVQVSRFSDGTRRITHITECVGMEGDLITMQDIFVFEKTGLTETGRVTGRFRATGIRPKFYERLRVVRHAVAGIDLPNRGGNLVKRHATCSLRLSSLSRPVHRDHGGSDAGHEVLRQQAQEAGQLHAEDCGRKGARGLDQQSSDGAVRRQPLLDGALHRRPGFRSKTASPDAAGRPGLVAHEAAGHVGDVLRHRRRGRDQVSDPRIWRQLSGIRRRYGVPALLLRQAHAYQAAEQAGRAVSRSAGVSGAFHARRPRVHHQPGDARRGIARAAGPGVPHAFQRTEPGRGAGSRAGQPVQPGSAAGRALLFVVGAAAKADRRQSRGNSDAAGGRDPRALPLERAGQSG